MLMISTLSYSQIRTYTFSSNGYSSTTTVVGRNAYTLTSSPYERGTISNRKYKKILKEQKEREIQNSLRKDSLRKELYLIKDTVEFYINERDSLFEIYKPHIFKAFNIYPNDEIAREKYLKEHKAEYDKRCEETDEIIFNLFLKAAKLNSFVLFSCLDDTDPFDYIRDKAHLIDNIRVNRKGYDYSLFINYSKKRYQELKEKLKGR